MAMRRGSPPRSPQRQAAVHARLEPPGLFNWRQASEVCALHTQNTVNWVSHFLAQGGPDVVQSLKARAAKLDGQVRQLKELKDIKRYRALQQDLKEKDRVSDVLRKLLLTGKGRSWTSDELNSEVDKVKKDTTSGTVQEEDLYLYGASRELLLRENKQLRRVIEQRLITARTAWTTTTNTNAGAPMAVGLLDSPLNRLLQASDASPQGDQSASPAPGTSQGRGTAGLTTPTKSQQATLALKAGVHMTRLRELQEAGQQLLEAARSYTLPAVSHVEVQVYDGSAGMQRMLQEQVSLLAAQKAQLLHKVADLESSLRLSEQQQQSVKQQAAAIRDAHNQLLSNQDTLSKDVRAYLASESARADTAERSLDESRAEARRLVHLNNELNQQLGEAHSQARVLQRAVEEKAQQVAALTHHYQQLKTGIDQLSGTLLSSNDNVSGQVMQALHALHVEHTKSLAQLTTAATKTQSTVMDLETAQKQLKTETGAARDAAVRALEALEQQLVAAQTRAVVAERERHQASKQLIAGQLLARLQDRRNAQALLQLKSELPGALADRLSHTHVQAAADGVEAPQQEGGVCQALPPPPHDEIDTHLMVDDGTAAIIQQSRQLRAQLQALIAIDGLSPPTRDARDTSCPVVPQIPWLSPGVPHKAHIPPTTSMQGLQSRPLVNPAPDAAFGTSSARPTLQAPNNLTPPAVHNKPTAAPVEPRATLAPPLSSPQLTLPGKIDYVPEHSAALDIHAKTSAARALPAPSPTTPVSAVVPTAPADGHAPHNNSRELPAPSLLPANTSAPQNDAAGLLEPAAPWNKGLRAQLTHMMTSPARRVAAASGQAPPTTAGQVGVVTDEASQPGARDFQNRVAFPVAALPPGHMSKADQ